MTAFFMAWSMFFRIPCPVQKWDESQKLNMLLWFPWIGVLIGAISAFLVWGMSFTPFPVFGAIVGALAPTLLPGLIHLDGFMDTADAVLSYGSHEKKMQILKDSHVGSFAVISVVVLTVVLVASWLQLDISGFPYFMLMIPGVTRSAVTLAIFTMKPLEHSSYAKIREQKVKPHMVVLAVATTVVLLADAVLLTEWFAVSAFVAYGVSWLVIATAKKSLGGMSGDISGSAVVIGETAGIVAMVILQKVLPMIFG